MTCLDTDFMIDLLRRKPEAERRLEDLVAEGEKLTTTPLNASELYKGAYGSSKPIEEAKKVRHLLETLDILEFSRAASETFGKLFIELERKGSNIGDFDLLIASIALTHGEPLLTKNARHFSKVPGLAVEGY
ncbi:MAG: type II toxin-antitoxin system VapC family toxin [Euryarchaeota archaeon]|nr:type II toxin-antitoxin system VapC family toxin [Euryarchaeota archaeon]MCG2737785.1 type II toxin-antitoxin system VapC family toxin [Candidatus Methanoperedenaceae archaeon]MDP3105433.1 type II toxin-antitoxin system VapC family toxin [Candidatus Methanoperedens sp.]MBU4223332.1 type II toxin-antitoxin system VapC family toxin [Euryarchaeota archaeon]MBU4340916.1 type II toxin-antitoxin system VapC family toxin [Euryarchaeota archaeon]